MLRAVRSASRHEWLVKAPGALHSGEAAQGIGAHQGARFEVALGPIGDLVALERADAAQAHSHRPTLAIELHGSDERRLTRCPPSAFASAALPAPVRVIDLHPSAQRAGVVALLHHLHQLVFERPRGVVVACPGAMPGASSPAAARTPGFATSGSGGPAGAAHRAHAQGPSRRQMTESLPCVAHETALAGRKYRAERESGPDYGARDHPPAR